MKRAEVYRDEGWRVHVRNGVIHDRHLAIRDRWATHGDDDPYPTHAAALTAAIEAVGLAPCTCYLLPERMHFTYYGATEPGSVYEPNPGCPQHRTRENGDDHGTD